MKQDLERDAKIFINGNNEIRHEQIQQSFPTFSFWTHILFYQISTF